MSEAEMTKQAKRPWMVWWVVAAALLLGAANWRIIATEIAPWLGASDPLEVSVSYRSKPGLEFLNFAIVSVVNRSHQPVTVRKLWVNDKLKQDNCVSVQNRTLQLGDDVAPHFTGCGKVVEVSVETDSSTRTYTFD